MEQGNEEFLLEFTRVGNFLKAVALDPVTGTEVSVVGPANGGRQMLARTAVAKLKYVLKRNAGGKTGI
jgi:hypothetical protein